MDGEAVRELRDGFRSPQTIQPGDDGFIARPDDWALVDPKSLIAPGPTAEALKVYTLAAVRDYVVANRDGVALEKTVIHVVSPQIVRLSGPLQERARNRETYVEATAQNLTDGFLGKFMALDEFIVGLMTRFVNTDELKAVLRLFGTVKHEGVKTLADDGITQTVTAKAGIALVSEAQVPNPVTLRPFRTFREVEQPASLFVLRVNGASTGTVTAGLFEADGVAWRIDAVERIARWLRVEALSTVAILA